MKKTVIAGLVAVVVALSMSRAEAGGRPVTQVTYVGGPAPVVVAAPPVQVVAPAPQVVYVQQPTVVYTAPAPQVVYVRPAYVHRPRVSFGIGFGVGVGLRLGGHGHHHHHHHGHYHHHR